MQRPITWKNLELTKVAQAAVDRRSESLRPRVRMADHLVSDALLWAVALAVAGRKAAHFPTAGRQGNEGAATPAALR